MAVTAAAFTTAGGGRLHSAWFEDNLDNLLAIWIERAGEGSDAYVTARVYQYAFTYLADMAQTRPALFKERNETTQFLASQLDYWQAQAAQYAADAQGMSNTGPILTRWT